MDLVSPPGMGRLARILLLIFCLPLCHLLAEDDRIVAPVTPTLPDCIFLFVSSFEEVPQAASGMVQNIIDNPDDNTVRLALSDWLEEQGLEDRAQFIRKQIQLSSILKDAGVTKISDLEEPATAQTLRDEAIALLSAHPEWTPNTTDSIEYTFERGLITKAKVDVGAFLQNLNEAEALEQLSNLLPYLRTAQELLLHGVNQDNLNLLRESGLLEVATQVSGEGFSDLTSFEGMTNIKSLYLHGLQIEDIRAIGTLTNLEILILGGEQLETPQTISISPLSNLNKLRSLELHHFQINDFSPLSGLTTLKTLDLPTTGLEDISFLSNLPNLVALGLSDNGFDDISVLSNLTQLQFLDLSDTSVDNISPLANLSQLRYLSLSFNELGDLSPLLSLTNLRQIGLSFLAPGVLDPLVNLQGSPQLFIEGTEITPELRTLLEAQGITLSDHEPLIYMKEIGYVE